MWKSHQLLNMNKLHDLIPTAITLILVASCSEYSSKDATNEQVRETGQSKQQSTTQQPAPELTPPTPHDASIVGATSCVVCHPSEYHAWELSTHFDSWQRLLNNPKSIQIASLVGIDDFRTSELCISCHGSGYEQDKQWHVISGVSCESCHSPARNWMDIHGDYGGFNVTRLSESAEHKTERLTRSAEAGMIHTRDIAGIAANCHSCHTINNESLVFLGGHPPLSGLNLLTWMQGEVRHNFVASNGKSNLVDSPNRLRVLALVGMMMEVEAALRGLAEASNRTNEYAMPMARRIGLGQRNIKTIQEYLIVPEADMALEAFESPPFVIDAGRREQMTAAADRIESVTEMLVANHDGSMFEALDGFMPPKTQFKGEAWPGPPMTKSLLDSPLYVPQLAYEKRREYELKLADAQRDYDADTKNEENIIWLGRRTAYLGLFDEAIEIFSAGLKLHPNSFKLRRHRGHRYITMRRLDDAIVDLTQAASLIENVSDEIEPDGLPNAQNKPRSTSHSNIYYHLGLAHYLKGDFEQARDAYLKCMKFSGNDDMLAATTHWLYMTLRRLGQEQDAAELLLPIHADMEIIENTSYHRLLLMYKGELTLDQVYDLVTRDSIDLTTTGYGVGNWFLAEGKTTQARNIFEQIITEPLWPAFGHIAAESELVRMNRSIPDQP